MSFEHWSNLKIYSPTNALSFETNFFLGFRVPLTANNEVLFFEGSKCFGNTVEIAYSVPSRDLREILHYG